MSDDQRTPFIRKLQFLMDRDDKKIPEISEKTGIPTTTIYNWFNRNDDNPKKDNLEKLARFFDVSLYYLTIDSCDEPSTFNGEPKKSNNNDNNLKDILELLLQLEPKELVEIKDYLTYKITKKDNEN